MLQLVVLNVKQVLQIHDHIIGKNELQGLAKDKSLDAVLERVHNRLQYGFIADVFDLAACYATFIAKGIALTMLTSVPQLQHCILRYRQTASISNLQTCHWVS